MKQLWLFIACVIPTALAGQEFRKVNGVVYRVSGETNGWVGIDGKVLQIIGGKDALVKWFDDLIYIRNCPGADSIIDGDTVHCLTLPVGMEEYKTVLGANKRVRAYDYGTKPTAQEIAPVREKWEKEEAARIASEERTRKAAEQAKREAIEARQKQIEAARSATTARLVAYQHQQASNGSPSFQIELGKRFMRGDGVETNLALARHWLKSACTNGESEATNLLRQINLQGASK